MRRQSPKRQREQKIYTKENRAFKAAHPICQIQVMCKGAPTQVVCHTKGRGIYYLDKKTWKAGCWPCENWLTTHGKQAIKMGLHQDRIGHD